MIDITKIFLKVATVVLVNEKNQALMILRNDMPIWELVGGMVDPGETFEEAVIREAKEEIGRDVILGTTIAEYYKKSDKPGHEDDYKHIVYYRGSFADDRPIELDEHVAYEWFDVDKLPANIGKLHRELIYLTVQGGSANQDIVPAWSSARYAATLPLEKLYGLEMWHNNPKVIAKRAANQMQFDPYSK